MSALGAISSSSISSSPLYSSLPLVPMNPTGLPRVDGGWDLYSALDVATEQQQPSSAINRTHLGQRRRRQRRHLNIPISSKSRDAQLYSTRQKHFLQVHNDGRIRTTTHADSIFSIFEVLLWCSIASSPLHPCLSDKNDASVFGVILFHFRQSDRYLCLNSKGQLYTAKRMEIVDAGDCAFQHEIVWHNHDIYYSWKYPGHTNTSHKMAVEDRHVTSDVSVNDDPTSGAFSDCQTRWFLGISGGGRPRTFRRSKCDGLRKSVLFIQRWLHRPPGPVEFSYPGLASIAAAKEEKRTTEGSVLPSVTSRQGRDSQRPAFHILLKRRRLSSSTESSSKAVGRTGSGKDRSTFCNNLLMNCDSVRVKDKPKKQNLMSEKAKKSKDIARNQ